MLPLSTSQLSSFDFVGKRCCMKLFEISDMNIVECCRMQFSFELPSIMLTRHYNKFLMQPQRLVKLRIFVSMLLFCCSIC